MNDLLTSDAVDEGTAVARLMATVVLPAHADPLSGSSVARPTPAERSDFVDRAYGEYRQLREAGVAVDPDAFCARFPAFQTSLRRLLEVHRELEENPGLIEQLGVRWPEPGEPFLGFRLLQELGRGAFARVFLAREQAVGGRLVAVKVSLQADNEAHTLGRLRHPNVVPVFSAQHDAGTGFSVVCMPFLGGSTLCDVLDYLATFKTRPAQADVLLDAARDERWPADGAPPPARALRRGRYLDGVLYLAERLADALAYVHAQGLLHRDLKPSNVLVSPNGEPVLLDFNLALDQALAERRLGGTLPYMPPELLEAMGRRRSGTPVPADARADLYALGVILYELLAGVHPFGPVPLKLPAAEVRAFLIDRQRQGPRPLRELNPHVDAGLAALIGRCLAWDPDARPATAWELAAALRRCQSLARRASRWAAGHIKALALAGVVLVAGAAAGAYEVATLPSPAARLAQEADNHSRDGRYEEAVKLFTRSLEADPNQPAVYFKRGRAYQLQADHDRAIKDYLRAAPETNERAAACLGYCLSFMNDHPNAIKCYERALEAGFTKAVVYNDLAYSYYRKGNYAGALKAATDALALDGGMRAAYYNRACACFNLFQDHQLPDVDMGLDDIRQTIARGPGTAKLYSKAAEFCALALHDRVNPQDDPLWAEGADYVHKAVEQGFPRQSLRITLTKQFRFLKDWEAQLPRDILPVSLSTGPDGQDVRFRLIDPLFGQSE
jgi:serine/threonine protein kinase/Tfp pilus assembly protein PilF